MRKKYNGIKLEITALDDVSVLFISNYGNGLFDNVAEDIFK